MQSHTLKRYLTFLLVAISFMLSGASANTQERKALPANEELPIIRGDCPRPIALTLAAANPTTFAAGDFTSAQLASPHMSGLGDPSINKNFLYTFQWNRDERCCQITKAELTLRIKANSTGGSSSSPDSGNDGIAIMHSGIAVQSAPAYTSWSFNAGFILVRTLTLNAAALNGLNASGHLSFAVQDDTGVLSASLHVSGCCLTTPK